jgi:hypothetical protein
MQRIDGDNPLHEMNTTLYYNKLDKPPIECNEGMSEELWSLLSIDTKRSIYAKCVEATMVYGSKPDGISSRIWNMITDDDKADVLLNTKMISGNLTTDAIKIILIILTYINTSKIQITIICLLF